jgi:hypothetical protein
MLQNNISITKDVRETARYFVMPSVFIGIGGYSKAVFPTLDRLFNEYYGFRPGPLQMVIFDFDEAKSESSANGKKYSIEPYLVSLPKKILKDVARKLRRKASIPWLKTLEPYVSLEHVRYAEAPGLNLFPQSGNLAWRLLWESHVLPELKIKLKGLHPVPQELDELERQGFKVSNRSCIWVIAGGGSTTGPTGLIPFVAELKRNKPPETNLFIVVFTPNSYRDKTDAHRNRGRAIFTATMESLLELFNGRVFDQPYNPSGSYKITLEEDPCDQIFLIDGSLCGGRTELKTEELGDLVANFLFKFASSQVGERALGIIGNLNAGLKPVKEVKNES